MNLKLKLSIDYHVGGSVHILLKPLVYLLSKLLGRTHSLEHVNEITIIKMLGGGSLVIAYPSLLSLKRKHPTLRINLVTTASIKPFAELLGFFDEIIIIRDDSAVHLAVDSVKAIHRLWRAQALIDLEIHSRLSSIFALLTCAINRIGIYTDVSYWRRSLYTHLLFYNKYAAVYSLYDQIAHLFGADDGDFQPAKAEFRKQVRRDMKLAAAEGKIKIGVAPGCSDLAKERMLPLKHWISILEKRCSIQDNLAVFFIGSSRDKEFTNEIISGLHKVLPQVECHDYCGAYNLKDSVSLISQMNTLYCIDSGLIHFARLLGIKTISFWGPTDPASLLRPDEKMPEETHYVRLTCSPCVHIVSESPCYGNNICMDASAQSENFRGNRNPRWPAR